MAFDDRAYILSSKDSPGGRGINAARVIHSFGGETLAIFPAGGERGARFEHYMQDCGFPVATVPIVNDIRLNLTITDRQGLTVKLNEIGPRLERGELSSVEGTVEAQLATRVLADAVRQPAAGSPVRFLCATDRRAAKKKASRHCSIPMARRSRAASKPGRPSSRRISRKPNGCSTPCC